MKPISGSLRLQILFALLTWYAIWFQTAAGLSVLGSYNPTKTTTQTAVTAGSRDGKHERRHYCCDDDDDDANPTCCETSRRSVLVGGMGRTLSLMAASNMIFCFFPDPALARAPGSKDVVASIQQIQDASKSLKTLQANWADYASIDAEGRAKSTDGARRILGGIAPQAGDAAIDAAKNTPLYRIDVAFVTVRKAVLEGSDAAAEATTAWRDKLDLERFEELADRVIYGTQKADGNFYSVLFAMKGTTMISDIFVETKKLVQQGIDDLDSMVLLLQEAGAPGV